MSQFDQSPTTGDKHYEGDTVWVFDGTKWVKQSPVIKTENIELSDPTHPASLTTNPRVLPPIPDDTDTQLEANKYYMAALSQLDEFVKGIYVSDSPPAEYSNGTLWFDSTEDQLTLYMYYDPDNNGTGTWVPASPPTSLDGVNATIDAALLVQDDLVARVGAGEGVQAALEATVTTALATQSNIEKSVSDILTTENTQQGQIDSLENKVDALEGTVIDAQYKLTARTTPNSGEFQIYDTNGSEAIVWDQVTSITFSKTDFQNQPHTFDLVGLDDYMRLGSPGSSSVYKIKSAKTETSTTIEFQIEFVSGTSIANQGFPYDFEFTPGFDASAYATVTYVDAQDGLDVKKTGDTMTGNLILSTSGQANDDGVRFYMKDTSSNTNLTIFPSGLLQSSNTIRVNKDTGDAFQVKDADGNTVAAKIHSDGHVETPRVFLTGEGADTNKRVIDVKQGQAGRLAYNSATRMSWGASTVWIGTTTTTGEASSTVSLDLQGNPITNVGTFTLNHTGQSNGNKFVIKGETDDGVDTDVFYSYKNDDGLTDAVNYKGRIDNGFNLVNKDYVDTKFAGVSTEILMPKSGGTFTGLVEFNNSANPQINFLKSGNNDIQVGGDWYVSLQTGDGGKVKLSRNLEMSNKEIKGVANPTTGQSAVNRDSLIGAKVVATSSGNASSGGFYYSSGRLFYKI